MQKILFLPFLPASNAWSTHTTHTLTHSLTHTPHTGTPISLTRTQFAHIINFSRQTWTGTPHRTAPDIATRLDHSQPAVPASPHTCSLHTDRSDTPTRRAAPRRAFVSLLTLRLLLHAHRHSHSHTTPASEVLSLPPSLSHPSIHPSTDTQTVVLCLSIGSLRSAPYCPVPPISYSAHLAPATCPPTHSLTPVRPVSFSHRGTLVGPDLPCLIKLGVRRP
ncbi:hypothetical protein LX32DRAFT_54779 [Colletotrichum zoysiae]|uniref:Uncharacterized protein n=1 Tax=Colletotrichum zoysiae TaxID=1216348 RepID=A0AAD9HAX5_9PEZI|nr:hypothetical protein LX32DRAFT_54779 [Colletotrichum zoysiae]